MDSVFPPLGNPPSLTLLHQSGISRQSINLLRTFKVFENEFANAWTYLVYANFEIVAMSWVNPQLGWECSSSVFAVKGLRETGNQGWHF
jgi:hypothetical protein